MNSRIWHEARNDSGHIQRLSQALNIHRVTAAVLVERGVATEAEARRFMDPSSASLEDASNLPDIHAAVDRIHEAVRQKQRIAVYGDYDVDGITSTALYLDWFRRRECPALFYIPHRMREGYGLNRGAIHFLKDQGVRLIITADCGTTSTAEIQLAKSLGMDVIVTDHHEVGPGAADASFEWPVVNPKRPGSRYPFDGLCTVGLAYKVLGMADGSGGPDPELDRGLDLVALGTVADVSPMTRENRYLVGRGLRVISEGNRPGIRALKAAAGWTGKEVGCGTVGFVLAPRINAVGRLSDAREGVRLLTTDSDEEAGRIASQLENWNRERQRIEQEMVDEAHEIIGREVDLEEEACIVLASSKWHVGVVGIGASRLTERYGRPSVLLSIDESGVARGSARSVPGVHIQEGLGSCADLLTAFGGHRQAAGLTVRRENIPGLRTRLSRHVRSVLGGVRIEPSLKVDAVVGWEELTFPLVFEFERLRPHGIGNPEPTLAVRGATAVESRVVGSNHLKLKLRKDGGRIFDAIGFRMGGEADRVRRSGRIDVAFTPENNVWQGEDRIQLRVKDIRYDS